MDDVLESIDLNPLVAAVGKNTHKLVQQAGDVVQEPKSSVEVGEGQGGGARTGATAGGGPGQQNTAQKGGSSSSQQRPVAQGGCDSSPQKPASQKIPLQAAGRGRQQDKSLQDVDQDGRLLPPFDDLYQKILAHETNLLGFLAVTSPKRPPYDRLE